MTPEIVVLAFLAVCVLFVAIAIGNAAAALTTLARAQERIADTQEREARELYSVRHPEDVYGVTGARYTGPTGMTGPR